MRGERWEVGGGRLNMDFMPPGRRTAGSPVPLRPSIKSVLKPCSSAVGCLGLNMVPLTMVPMGSKNAEKSLSEISPI